MSSAKVVYLSLQHVVQAVISFYGLRHSYVAITNLRKYEETTKKAAKWSQEAQNQLNKTQTTQAAGAISTFLSLLAAIILVIPMNSSPWWTKPSAATAMLVVTMTARSYIKSFWAPGEKDSKGNEKGTKVPLPGLEDYNLAVQKTEDLLKCLEYLEYSWVISSALGWFIRWT